MVSTCFCFVVSKIFFIDFCLKARHAYDDSVTEQFRFLKLLPGSTLDSDLGHLVLFFLSIFF